MPHSVQVDLVTRRQDGGFVFVLVAEGPWPEAETERRLRALQERLHHCLDAALGGHLAARYPASRGQRLTLRVDAYDTPRTATESFLAGYREYVASHPEVREALKQSGDVSDIDMEFQWFSIAGLQAAQRARQPAPSPAPSFLARMKRWLGRA